MVEPVFLPGGRRTSQRTLRVCLHQVLPPPRALPGGPHQRDHMADARADTALGQLYIGVRPRPFVAGLGFWIVPDAASGLVTQAVLSAPPRRCKRSARPGLKRGQRSTTSHHNACSCSTSTATYGPPRTNLAAHDAHRQRCSRPPVATRPGDTLTADAGHDRSAPRSLGERALSAGPADNQADVGLAEHAFGHHPRTC